MRNTTRISHPPIMLALSLLVGAGCGLSKADPVQNDREIPKKESHAQKEASSREALSATTLDPDFPLESLDPGAKPAWPAPKPRGDGAPITLRAVRADGRIEVWGYGAPAGAAGIAFRIRFLDDAGTVRDETTVSTPFTPEPNGWYRITRVEPDSTKAANVTRAAVQAYGVASSERGKAKPLWVPASANQIDWRFDFPKEAQKESGSSAIGFAVLGRTKTTVTSGGFREPAPPAETIVHLGLYNGTDHPVTSVVFELQARSGGADVAAIGGSWVPLLGDQPVPSIPPHSWSQVDVSTSKDVDKVLAADTFVLTVKSLLPAT